jgi:3-oxoacyl-[acyl-carrier protein] reductase
MKNKHTVLVTGASKGIGFAIACKFKSLGYLVLTPGRNEMDLSENKSIDLYLKNLKQPIDILVNNAGISILAKSNQISDEDITKTLQVNLIAPIRITRAIIPMMVANKYGRIANISSIWNTITKPKRLIYSVSKSGLSSATRTWAVELAEHNILVNAVAPGFVDTEMTRKNNNTGSMKRLADSVPLKRLATSKEIAEVVEFLCSDRNSYLTGQTIYVDGGFTCI